MDPTRLAEWLKQPQRVLWGFVIVVALMLWGPNWFIDGLRVEEFIDEYRGFIGVAFLFFLVAALTNTLHLLGQHALKKWQGRKLEEEAERRTCCTGGKRSLLQFQWFRQPLGLGSYYYEAPRVTATGRPSPEAFLIRRRPARGESTAGDHEYLCIGGHWSKRNPHPPVDRVFNSSRAADEYARRLNNGIPTKCELLLTVCGGFIAVAETIGLLT